MANWRNRRQPFGDPQLKTPARRRLRELIRTKRLPCLAPNCKYPGIPIDYRPRRKGDPYNPLAYELDEIIPRFLGGHADNPANVRPRHAGCNRADGARIATAKRVAARRPPEPLIAEDW